MTTAATRGRPLASSRETLADAASELFLEQGYERTTVADITSRAGVSRSSFFNYFDGKAAALWFALDERLEGLAADTGAGSPDALATFVDALDAAPPHTLALAITNADVMGVRGELGTGRALRQAALADTLTPEIARTLARAAGPQQAAPMRAEIAAAAQAAAVFAGIWRWAELGAGTHRLGDIIAAALSPSPTPAAGTTGAARDRAAAERPLRVAVIGAGAIGARVITELHAGRVAGATLAGVVTRRPGRLADRLGDVAADLTDFGDDLDRAIRGSDLVVECAGIPAARVAAPQVLAAGGTLLLVSIGALADEAIRQQLLTAPGVLRLASGAIGGLDALASAARPGGIADGITAATLTSTQTASSLVQPWMSDAEARALREAAEPVELFAGSVADAVARYPGSLNVACALAHATGLWDEVLVRLVADPAATRTTHEITASGHAGSYAFTLTNDVSDANPASSAIVAESVLRAVAEFARPTGAFA